MIFFPRSIIPYLIYNKIQNIIHNLYNHRLKVKVKSQSLTCDIRSLNFKSFLIVCMFAKNEFLSSNRVFLFVSVDVEQFTVIHFLNQNARLNPQHLFYIFNMFENEITLILLIY